MPSLYPYQAEAVKQLLSGKHICIAETGVGKTVIGLTWAKLTGKQSVLVVTTASVRDAHNYEKEALVWCGEEWVRSLDNFTIISWAGLVKWLDAHYDDAVNYAVIFDEVDCAKSGVSSKRGKAFIQLCARTNTWTGYTATAGEKWIDFYPYFTACGLVRNKTAFMREYCVMQTYRGFPEITSYRNTDRLKEMWGDISFVPNAKHILEQLPAETHNVVEFKAPQQYKTVLKTECDLNGELLENTMSMCHYLRQMCLTPAKLQWVEDMVRTTPSNMVIFYNYIEEGDRLEKVVRKALGKKPKIWRIDGKHHDIPTAETCGDRDVILTQWTSGSRGLNLQFVNYWVSVSPNYSYSVSVQGRGRIKRVGQQRPMFFYYCYCRGTIEEDIYACLKSKKDFSEDLWDKARKGVDKNITV